jgi:hypothetical protein
MAAKFFAKTKQKLLGKEHTVDEEFEAQRAIYIDFKKLVVDLKRNLYRLATEIKDLVGAQVLFYIYNYYYFKRKLICNN